MGGKNRKKRPASYAWAFDPGQTGHLSDDALDGLDYAARLAEDAQNRRHQMLRREREQLPALTIQDIADGTGRNAAAVRRCIKLARTDLYGSISDAGIRYRRRRRKHLEQRPPRSCIEPGCTNLLPWDASAARDYCEHHSTAAARTARSRANRRT